MSEMGRRRPDFPAFACDAVLRKKGDARLVARRARGFPRPFQNSSNWLLTGERSPAYKPDIAAALSAGGDLSSSTTVGSWPAFVGGKVLLLNSGGSVF